MNKQVSYVIPIYPVTDGVNMGIGYVGHYTDYLPAAFTYDEGILYAAPVENGTTVNTPAGPFIVVNGNWLPVNNNKRLAFEWTKVKEA